VGGASASPAWWRRQVDWVKWVKWVDWVKGVGGASAHRGGGARVWRRHLDLLTRVRHYCNVIEAPWLVNGGHGASLMRWELRGTCSCSRASATVAGAGEEARCEGIRSRGHAQAS
jgi:hypothetical protein